MTEEKPKELKGRGLCSASVILAVGFQTFYPLIVKVIFLLPIFIYSVITM